MSLSPAQTSKHWRRWAAVTAANDWTMSGGRIHPEAGASRDLSIWHKLVWRTAEQLALRDRRAITAEDLRHACYLVATTAVPGRDPRTRAVGSLRDLVNWSFSRLLCLWGDEKDMAGLLIDPDCLTSSMHWDHPENAERQRLVIGLQRSPRGAEYARRIAADMYGTRMIEDLDAGQLRNLSRLVHQRQHATA